jgi:phospho-N-acetylmuramoyl-pentapeptide-transferase
LLYHILYSLSDSISGLHVAKYLTFRAGVAMLTSLFMSFALSPWFIRKLKSKQIGQVVRDDGPKSHFSKAGTPTMGGGLIIMAVVIPCLLWMDLTNSYMWYALAIFAGYSLLGFVDDYSKVTKKNSKGVTARQKLFWQILIAGVICTTHFFQNHVTGDVPIPFIKKWVIPLGYLYIPFSIFIIVGFSNAVNLTDGLDGLAIGPVMIAAACFAILSYVTGHSEFAEYLNYPYVRGAGELSIFSTSLIGAGMGFLWYNTYPAQVFMGDVGSLPLGGAIGTLAVMTNHELLVVIIGGVFVAEAASVVTQVASFKLTGKRVFRMAPIHHHFELKGWPEPKVIVRFWIIAVVLAMIGLLSLKLR